MSHDHGHHSLHRPRSRSRSRGRERDRDRPRSSLQSEHDRERSRDHHHHHHHHHDSHRDHHNRTSREQQDRGRERDRDRDRRDRDRSREHHHHHHHHRHEHREPVSRDATRDGNLGSSHGNLGSSSNEGFRGSSSSGGGGGSIGAHGHAQRGVKPELVGLGASASTRPRVPPTSSSAKPPSATLLHHKQNAASNPQRGLSAFFTRLPKPGVSSAPITSPAVSATKKKKKKTITKKKTPKTLKSGRKAASRGVKLQSHNSDSDFESDGGGSAIGALHLLFKKKTKKSKKADGGDGQDQNAGDDDDDAGSAKKSRKRKASKSSSLRKKKTLKGPKDSEPAPKTKRPRAKSTRQRAKASNAKSAQPKGDKLALFSSSKKNSDTKRGKGLSKPLKLPPKAPAQVEEELRCDLCSRVKPSKAVVNADPDSVLQGPPPPKPAWIQKKLFEGDGAENDEEEVALVELKTDMLVCKDCGLRVHWRCYRSPFINTQLRDWLCRWCTHVAEQQKPKSLPNPDEATFGDEKVLDVQGDSENQPPKSRKELEGQWQAAWPVERPADTQCSWMNSRAYFELCCLVTVLNRIDGLGIPELTFADIEDVLRDPIDNKMLGDIITAVLKIVSETTIRKTGRATWLNVWQQELEEFPDEYNAEDVVQFLQKMAEEEEVSDDEENSHSGEPNSDEEGEQPKAKKGDDDEDWIEEEEDSDSSEGGPFRPRKTKPAPAAQPREPSKPPKPVPVAWLYRLEPERRLQLIVDTLGVFLAHKSMKLREGLKEVDPIDLRFKPVGKGQNGDLFWLTQTEGEVRLVREAITKKSVANSSGGGSGATTATAEQECTSVLTVVVWTPEGLKELCEHVRLAQRPGEIQLFNSLSDIVADLLAKEQKAARARARREQQRRQQELSLLYAMQRETGGRRRTRKPVDYSGRAYDAQFKGLI